jgi:hypothetical protein
MEEWKVNNPEGIPVKSEDDDETIKVDDTQIRNRKKGRR